MKKHLLLFFSFLLFFNFSSLLATSPEFNYDGGEISLPDGSTEINLCVGDGLPDLLEVNRENYEGMFTAWVITDVDGIILDIPEGPPFDFEEAGEGVCLIWHMGYKDIVGSFSPGMHKDDVYGWLDYSNPITVTRTEVGVAEITLSSGGVTLETCVGDGISDEFTVNVVGGKGDSVAWIITDPDLNILGLPEGPTFDLEGAGPGTCLLWYVNYNGNLSGVEVGANAGDIGGCHTLSNPITITRKAATPSKLTLASNGTTEIEICAGDDISDEFEVTIEAGDGEFSTWVITDPDLNIIGLPEGPSFDLEGAGEGTCLIWYVTYNGEISGVELGENAGNISGCFALSNEIRVSRKGITPSAIEIEGGGTEITICAGDGVEDSFTAISTGAEDYTKVWIITDPDLNILGLPEGPTFDLEGAGEGTCLLWEFTLNGELVGAEVGVNVSTLTGCFALSNAITVTRNGVDGGSLSLTGGGSTIEICAGDGVSDEFIPVLEGNVGENSAWVITDPDLNILGLPEGPTFDLEGAGEGTCLIWHLSFNGDIVGTEIGSNASNLSGCYSLSNAITVIRTGVNGGEIIIEGGGTELEICAGDGISDEFSATLAESLGDSSFWVITDTDLNILGLPEGPIFDLEGAGAGICLIWNLSYNGELLGVELGANTADLSGCFSLSNPITVTRNGVSGGNISLEGGETEIEICAGDNNSDAFTPILSGAEGDSMIWLITDPELNILKVTNDTIFDLEGAGTGTCLIWHLSFNGDVGGIEIDSNASNISGCYALSNPITVIRKGISSSIITLGGQVSKEICVGNGVIDSFSLDIIPGEGDSSIWVITDTQMKILGLPESNHFNFEEAGPGLCLIWLVNYNGELNGAEIGENASALEGCYILSNPFQVQRQEVSPGSIEIEGGGTEITICAGDMVSDSFTVVLADNIGDSSKWVITDPDLNILGLPDGPSFDLEGAGAGTCLIWHLSYNGDIIGLEVDSSVANLEGCFVLSNAIIVTRVTEGTNCGTLSLQASHINIFPNPVSENLNLTSSYFMENGFDIEIYNSFGQKVMLKRSLDAQSMEIDISSLEPGLFLMKIKGESEQVVKQFIKL